MCFKGLLLSTKIQNRPIFLTASLLSHVFHIPNEGITLNSTSMDSAKLYTIMTKKVFTPHSSLNVNVNTFPPLQRVLHHIFITIIYPKDGGRELVTAVHHLLFYYIFQAEQINLPSIMLQLMYTRLAHKKRSLPYACHITSLILHCFPNLQLEEVFILQPKDFYIAISIQQRMQYRKQGQVLRRNINFSSSGRFFIEAATEHATANMP